MAPRLSVIVCSVAPIALSRTAAASSGLRGSMLRTPPEIGTSSRAGFATACHGVPAQYAFVRSRVFSNPALKRRWRLMHAQSIKDPKPRAVQRPRIWRGKASLSRSRPARSKNRAYRRPLVPHLPAVVGCGHAKKKRNPPAGRFEYCASRSLATCRQLRSWPSSW